jgi:PEP-CTERM motif
MNAVRYFYALAIVLVAAAGSAQAGEISWNTWTSNTSGSITVGSTPISVGFATTNYSADIANYPSWTPSKSYADGTIVDNAPVASNGIIQLLGGTDALNTLSFSTPITDPVVAIWSLGSGGAPASFVFGATPTFVAGGPSAEYGGSAITVSGDVVSGAEGNGTVEFIGTFSSITWTNPQFEDWYGFNVGVAGVASVPEPSTFVLTLAGVACLGLTRAVRRK